MFGIPRRYSHFIFGVIQAGLTSLIAAGIASFPSPNPGQFFSLAIVPVRRVDRNVAGRGVGRSGYQRNLGRDHARGSSIPDVCCPRKRTYAPQTGMSALGQERTGCATVAKTLFFKVMSYADRNTLAFRHRHRCNRPRMADLVRLEFFYTQGLKFKYIASFPNNQGLDAIQ